MSKVKLKDTFTVTVDGETKHLKMKHGLLNELVRAIGDIDGVAEIAFDTDLRDSLLIELFSPRDEEGVITNKINVFNMDISSDDVVDLLEWVTEHVTDFLLKQMQRAKKVMEANKDQMKALMPTSTGTPT